MQGAAGCAEQDGSRMEGKRETNKPEHWDGHRGTNRTNKVKSAIEALKMVGTGESDSISGLFSVFFGATKTLDAWR